MTHGDRGAIQIRNRQRAPHGLGAARLGNGLTVALHAPRCRVVKLTYAVRGGSVKGGQAVGSPF